MIWPNKSLEREVFAAPQFIVIDFCYDCELYKTGKTYDLCLYIVIKSDRMYVLNVARKLYFFKYLDFYPKTDYSIPNQ